MTNTQKPQPEPQVYKEYEYGIFLGFVADGLWRNNRFMAEVIGVGEDTIADWKKRDEVKRLRQEAISGDLKKWKRTADAERRLTEQGMDFDAEKVDVKMEVVVKGLEGLE
jgi:hypothetical protein